MSRHYVVSKLAPKPPLPKEVERTSTRSYIDRWGTEYDVIWNGQRADPSLTGDYAGAST